MRSSTNGTYPGTTTAGPEAVLRSNLRSITGDGISYSVMIGTGESWLAAFALAAGLGALHASLVTTLPMLAGAVVQLLTPFAVRHLGSYRRWIVPCAVLQALCFVPLAVAPLAGPFPAVALYAVTTAYWATGLSTSPAWNAWVTALVPRELRARYFAHRTRWSQLSLLLSAMGGGAFLHAMDRAGHAGMGFAVLFTLAAAARLLSAFFLARQTEPDGLAEELVLSNPRRLVRDLTGEHAGRLLAYLIALYAGVFVAAPFFTPFMLGPLGLSYAEFMTLSATAFVARIAVLPMLGRAVEGHGARAVLWLGAIGVIPLPALWLVSDGFLYLVVLQLAAGSAWAAVEFGTMISIFERIPARERASILSFFNLANAVSMALGSAVGAVIFHSAGGGGAAYAWIFVASTAARVLALVLLRGAPEPLAPRGREARLRTLTVRPSAASIQRPILATLAESDGVAPQPPSGDESA